MTPCTRCYARLRSSALCSAAEDNGPAELQLLPDRKNHVFQPILPRCSGFALISKYDQSAPTHNETPHMDAHLIGIDLAHLLIKLNAHAEKQRPVTAAECPADAARKETRAEAN